MRDYGVEAKRQRQERRQACAKAFEAVAEQLLAVAGWTRDGDRLGSASGVKVTHAYGVVRVRPAYEDHGNREVSYKPRKDGTCNVAAAVKRALACDASALEAQGRRREFDAWRRQVESEVHAALPGWKVGWIRLQGDQITLEVRPVGHPGLLVRVYGEGNADATVAVLKRYLKPIEDET